MRKLNFSSGPATLPEPVLRAAQEAIWDLDGSGIGLLEHSHRGKEFGRVLDGAEAAIREVGGIGDDFAVLFVTAGATHHFAMVPRNFLGPNDTVDVCHTGVWSQKVIDEAKRVGNVHVACSGAPEFSAVPTQFAWSPAPRYVHYTSNETIYGTEWSAPPPAPAPLVCDASSDIFSRPLPLANHALIYAGAQKNLGPSGLTVVVIRDDLAKRGAESLPTMLRYATHVESRSLYNTPPVFGIYILRLVLKWLVGNGGLAAMAAANRRKAGKLYAEIDRTGFFRGHAAPDSRSSMNVTFRLPSVELDTLFVQEATAAELDGLEGHRSVGGLRASVYNAFPEEGIDALVAFMREFERRRG